MALKCYKAKVPGSLMLFGEHAVLCGKTALVGAINKYITATLIPRGDDIVHIKSSIGEYSVKLSELKEEDNFIFILTAIMRNKSDLCYGFDLLIEADFSHEVGFGSSAAVTVATLAVLRYAINGVMPDKLSLFYEAFAVVHEVQKTGSGADVAASIFGGILAYRRVPFSSLFIEKLSNLIPLTVVYSGYKVATPIVIRQVADLYCRHLPIFEHIYDAMEQCVFQAVWAIKNESWQNLGELMNIHQGLQEAIGVSDSCLSKLVFALRNEEDINGAKISGAGLGDCVIGLGTVENFGAMQVDLQLVTEGLQIFSSL